MSHPRCVLAYFERVGAEVLNFRRAMVRSYRGSYYIERALIKISSEGDVTCTEKEFAPTEEEAAAMKEALQGIEFPRTITARTTQGIPAKGELYEFLDRKSGEIIMVQERRTSADGSKQYIPWVFLSNGEWVAMEPDGALPFWKPAESKGPGARIMIHEGAKAALAASNLPTYHPWYEELRHYEHWGMIGGALAPHRADYSELDREQPIEVIYVCDNDLPGRMALHNVSKQRRKSLKGAVFGSDFPHAFDLADPMPKKLFTRGKRYIGPAFKDLLRPASWATDLQPAADGKGRPKAVIRQEFLEEWLHCTQPECFIHKDWPSQMYSPSEFNNLVAPFSDVDDTAKLVRRDSASKSVGLKYCPDAAPGLSAGNRWINTYEPSPIVPEHGSNYCPFTAFMQHLVPAEHDRVELMRWCATLIARPERRILYGVLAVSETQGIGKGTLCEKILAPLVGMQNVSFPTEQELVDSNFNYWLAHKRLAVVHEIYAGQSSKAYNRLKSSITDRHVTVSRKYQANYDIENWIHIFACSNSMRAMKLSIDDRRWLVPALTDKTQPVGYWEDLNNWLRYEGGLQAVAYWAHVFVEKFGAVEPGAPAPWSTAKLEMIEESYSPGQELAMNVLQDIDRKIRAGKLPPDSFLIDRQLVALIKEVVHEGRETGRIEKPLTIRKLAKALQWNCGRQQITGSQFGLSMARGRIMSPSPERAAMDVSANGPTDVKPVDLSGWKEM